MIRVLLNHFRSGAPGSFLQPLPKEDVKTILNEPTNAQDASLVIQHPREKLKSVHYSWLIPEIEKFPKDLQPFVVASLQTQLAPRIRNMLKQEGNFPLPAPFMQNYLLNKLYSQMAFSELLPYQYLPNSLLVPLIEMTKEELVELIDFLGVHDLAEEIRHIVDKKNLKRIYNCLNTKKQHFLRMCLHKKEKVTSSRLGLDKWQGECDKLESLLHRRGLVRLGKALSGEHPDFIWHIIHRLDTGRGRLLERYISPEAIPGITQVMVQEVLNIINFFKKMSGP